MDYLKTKQPFCQTRVSGSTFVNADCFDVFPFIEDKSIDAIICDLPYGTTACKWDSVLPFDKLWEQYERIIKPNGAIILFGSQPFTSALIMSNPKLFKYELIWDKKTGLGFLDSKFRPLKSHENIIIFGLGGCSNGSKIPMKYNPQGLIETTKQNKNTKSNILNSEPKKRENLGTTHTNYPKSIHTFSRVSGNHPTEKPLELLEYLVKTYTNENDMVLDNTMGSGTTNLACIKSNRKSIGIEKEKQYYDVAVRRASEYSIVDIYKNIQTKENYDKLLSSGMFWEFHPELSGKWDIDIEVVQYCH